jgi:glycosyltransferase involved in cell wall biosynthesis
MKVLVFDSVSDRYGSSRICRLIIDSLRVCGHDVHAYCGIERLPLEQQYSKPLRLPLLVMASLRSRPFGYFLQFCSQFFSFGSNCKSIFGKSELIYCNTLATLPVAFWSRVFGLKTVIHLHETSGSPIVRMLGRCLLPLSAHCVLCVSDAVARCWFIDRHPKTKVVRNGITDLTESEVRKLYLPRCYDLTFVGRITEQKGIGVFLAALQYFENNYSELFSSRITVAIAGGPLPGVSIPLELQNISRFSNLEVVYLGEVDDPGSLFLSTKVACVPSLFQDPFPTVVLEAMRAGCCVVASDLGGSREALRNARGALVKAGDLNALINGIVRQHAEWSHQTIEHNRLAFEAEFTLEHFRARLLGLAILNQDVPK